MEKIIGDVVIYEIDSVIQSPIPARSLSKIDYLKRFTQEERIAIRDSAKINSTVNDYVELMNAASSINLDDPDTVYGLNALELAGLLDAGRAGVILS
jgi:hypothetical protein